MKRDESDQPGRDKIKAPGGDNQESLWESHHNVSAKEPVEEVQERSVENAREQAYQTGSVIELKQNGKADVKVGVEQETRAKSRFRDMQDVKQTQFSDDFRKANFCSRFFFVYLNNIVRKARENKYTLTDDMVINMNTETPANGEDESYLEVK